ncbi:MAG: alpha/beta hydrolase [Rhizobium sp.]|nr:MAG: alpha/beta hydrolase [Rhizobium sp.]
MNPSLLDTHPHSPVQSARLSDWARTSRSGVRYVETDAVHFRIREDGAGDATIVFFADGPNALEHHDPIFDRVSKWSRVIVVDPPGFGFSTPKPHFDFTLDAFTNSYVELLSSLGGPFVLCPTCTNVYPSVLIAAKCPELVSHLVLIQALGWEQEKIWTSKIVDPAGDLAKPFLGQQINYRTRASAPKTWYPNALGTSHLAEPFLKQSSDCFAHGGNFCLASLIQNWFGPGIADPSFPLFNQPALAVWGMNDRSHRRSDKRTLLGIASHARYVERENVGHFPEIENSEWFEALLREFLRESV